MGYADVDAVDPPIEFVVPVDPILPSLATGKLLCRRLEPHIVGTRPTNDCNG
jgi:hypothetical protein